MRIESKRVGGIRFVKLGPWSLSISRARRFKGDWLEHMPWLAKASEVEVIVCMVAWPLIAALAIQPVAWLAESWLAGR